MPQFSLAGGIFSSAVNLEITNTFGGTIRYTTDGSEPEITSPVVPASLAINKTTVVRARIFRTNYVPGEVITQTYFIDTNNEIGTLPVVALSTDPANFWDAQKGIYAQNFKPDWEVPINIEFFENDGSDRAGFNLAAGAKINGLYSWQLPQKMLGIYFRKSYGEGKLDYPLLFDRDRKVFDSFALRASGSDWAYTLFRDGMTQSLSGLNTDVDFQGQRACVVYVNGEYLGIHNIRSKINEDFIVQNHNLGDQKIDMIENEDFVETGSLDRYAAFEALYQKDLSVQSNYNAVAEQMDIENFTDFIITEIYSQNTSVDHNIMAWKPQESGKWKWILNDLDRGFFKPSSNMISFYVNRDVIPLEQLLLNDGYRKYFGKRMADHLFTSFNPIRVKEIIDQFKNTIQNEIPKHINRWEGTSSSYGDPISSVNSWNNQVEVLKAFADARPTALLNDLQNYGFDQSEALSVSVYPENAGNILFNGLKMGQSSSFGSYPINEEIQLEIIEKGAAVFKGWAKEQANVLVAENENWKYNDNGEAPAINWMMPEYSDADWKQGQAELGYGDGDENTVLGYGNDSGNKYITSYFRKTFTVTDSDVKNLKIRLKCDDGAVVYLNGEEVARENLPTGIIDWQTKALNAIGGSSEDDFTIYTIEQNLLITGENTVAVEVHQASGNSSDISFDLELSAVMVNTNQFISTNPTLKFTHIESEGLVAVFESDESCVLPTEITAEMILKKDCSPYKVPDNVTVTSGGKLIIEAGVELWMTDDVSIKVNGTLDAKGTENEPVVFRSNPSAVHQKWGILNFINADTSFLKNVVIEDASKGSHPIREIAAVSAFNSVVRIDGAVIENVYENPVLGRYSDIEMINSRLHSKITGDLINVKYGKGLVDNCEFIGNDMPDTDAIDFDGIKDGLIQNCVITDFHGFNSDAIDIGEKTTNFTIKNVAVYNITDKGVSVGQQSTGSISNSIFVNSNLGMGLKDSSRVTIDHCTFYNNGIAVSCYEKNAGDAGGNAKVSNSILSNAYDASYFSDTKSSLKIKNTASDNAILPAGNNNIFADPQFQNPNRFDFSLAGTSPCIAAANDGNMGANLKFMQTFNEPIISSIAYKSVLGQDVLEFVVLSNVGTSEIDLSGYQFTKGFTFTFPENSLLQSGAQVVVTNNSLADFWSTKNLDVYQWESGRLADEGETLQLINRSGIVVDNVYYNQNTSWPDVSKDEGISLHSTNLDNHFGENWKVLPLDVVAGAEDLPTNSELRFYPNPTTGIVHLSGLNPSESLLNVYNLSGVKVISVRLNSLHSEIDLGSLPSGIYLLQAGSVTERIVLRK